MVGRSVVSVHVGQCGCQVGQSLWPLLVGEASEDPDCMLLNGSSPRAVYIDMEERVVNRLSDHSFVVKHHSGSGNNWARGYHEFGRSSVFGESSIDLIRRQIEMCESCDSVLFFASSSGGTGSGLGSYLVTQARNHFGAMPIFVFPVVSSPSHSDVVTGSYNTALAMREWIDNASAVIPFDNQAIKGSNELICSFVSSLTACMRFPSCEVSTRVSDITRLGQSVLVPSYTAVASSSISNVEKEFDSKFSDISSGKCRLLSLPKPKGKEKVGGFGLVARISATARITTSDAVRNATRIWPHKNIPRGHEFLGVAPQCGNALAASLASVSSTSSTSGLLRRIAQEADGLLRKRAHLHHYGEWMDANDILDCIHSLNLN